MCPDITRKNATTAIRILPWITAVAIVVLDRLSKSMIIDRLAVGSWYEVFPGLTLTHVHNRGIAFSLFADGGPLSRLLLHAVILTAVVLIAWMMVRHSNPSLMTALAFGLILGGAVGNLIDRVLYGWVVDFIHVWARIGERTWSWPDFNVADSAITVGACLLVISEFSSSKSRQTRDQADASDSL